ncbi:HAMP domain-containing sensor histidine kinase [Thermomonas sp. LB-4]|uniref:sensor histidine kinase n=1 Tax=Thermomonas sp. LB-4 TaxID=3102790 RepID=UPI002ED7CD1E
MSAPRPRRPLSLRQRFALLATLLGLLLGGLASVALLAVAEDYEYVLANEILHGQAEDYGLRLANRLPAQLPRTQRLRGYRIGDPALPPGYAGFPPGVHEDPHNEEAHVGVFDTAAGRLVFVIDLGDIEAMERRLHLLVAAMLLSCTALAGWLGWWLAGIALKPVRSLAEGVESLPVQPQPTRLAAAVSDDDLGRLARAIDGYQARLVDADAREQAFLADASHELRTPLAVIQGVAEVLLDDDGASPAQRARHARLARGVGDMHRLLEAMLAAARRRPLQLETIAAAPLLREAAAIALAGKPGITASIDADGDLHTAPREAVLLVAGLARKLAQPRTEASLELVLESGQIVLRMTPEDADANAATALRADTGTGSALLDRLAQRLGWQVAFDGSARVCVELNSDPAVKA